MGASASLQTEKKSEVQFEYLQEWILKKVMDYLSFKEANKVASCHSRIRSIFSCHSGVWQDALVACIFGTSRTPKNVFEFISTDQYKSRILFHNDLIENLSQIPPENFSIYKHCRRLEGKPFTDPEILIHLLKISLFPETLAGHFEYDDSVSYKICDRTKTVLFGDIWQNRVGDLDSLEYSCAWLADYLAMLFYVCKHPKVLTEICNQYGCMRGPWAGFLFTDDMKFEEKEIIRYDQWLQGGQNTCNMEYMKSDKGFRSLVNLQKIRQRLGKETLNIKITNMKFGTQERKEDIEPTTSEVNKREKENLQEGLTGKSTSIEPNPNLQLPPFYPDCGLSTDRDKISQIIPDKLYLTSYRGAQEKPQLLQLGVTGIVRVGGNFLEESNPHEDVFAYLSIEIREDQAFLEQKDFLNALNFIGNQAVCLVHCTGGTSRSTTVLFAYLMAAKSMTLMGAFKLVKQARPVIWPNLKWMKMLVNFEKEQMGICTIDLNEYEKWENFDIEAYKGNKIHYKENI